MLRDNSTGHPPAPPPRQTRRRRSIQETSGFDTWLHARPSARSSISGLSRRFCIQMRLIHWRSIYALAFIVPRKLLKQQRIACRFFFFSSPGCSCVKGECVNDTDWKVQIDLYWSFWIRRVSPALMGRSSLQLFKMFVRIRLLYLS